MVSETHKFNLLNATKYKVELNQCFEAEIIQQLMYKLCHLNFNRAGASKRPAVVMYAQKVAKLVNTISGKEYNSVKIHDSIAQKLNLYYC